MRGSASRAPAGASQTTLTVSPVLPAKCLSSRSAVALLSLPGVDGIVALKSFAMGPQRMVGLDLSVWAAEGVTPDDAKARLNRALDRLVLNLKS